MVVSLGSPAPGKVAPAPRGSWLVKATAVVAFCCLAGLLTVESPGALLAAGGAWTRDFGLRQLSTGAHRTSRFHLSPSLHATRAPKEVVYNFKLGKIVRFVGGVEKSVYTINGLLPGPTIEVRSGDVLVVNVINGLEEESSLHWHGLRHEHGTNHMDGAIGVTQCPILPGASFQYRFQISQSQSGTFWYHSHHETQRADGLFGAFIVHAPVDSIAALAHDDLRPRLSRPGAELQPRSVVLNDEHVLLIGDWYHRTGAEVFGWYMSARSRGVEPVPDIVLTNGKGVFECARSRRVIVCDEEKGVVPRTLLDPYRSHRLRLVNTGGLANIHFSIDEHVLEVIEADGHLIEPIFLKELSIAPGQRYSIRISPPRNGTLFWMQTRVDREDFLIPNAALNKEARGVLEYSQTPTALLPETRQWQSLTKADKVNVLTLQPLLVKDRVLPEATGEHVMFYVTTMPRNANGGKPVGYVNQTTWVPNLKSPLLARHDPLRGPTPRGVHELVVATNRTAVTVIDLIVNNLEEGPHPFHLHGHSFWPLITHASRLGGGSYRYSHPPNYPTSAPVLRDTFVIPARGHAVFRIRFDTPGLWLFHCHVQVHQAAGMAMTFDVRSQDLALAEGEQARAACLTKF